MIDLDVSHGRIIEFWVFSATIYDVRQLSNFTSHPSLCSGQSIACYRYLLLLLSGEPRRGRFSPAAKLVAVPAPQSKRAQFHGWLPALLISTVALWSKSTQLKVPR